ncbi:MAG: hypothetical protein D8M59_02330 [Planctomycetes bacterium]|nr:hypothetical protein [Planctomycetota bacterium]NOG54444.1 hypothetical protein [Planctomycetota bacterium]
MTTRDQSGDAPTLIRQAYALVRSNPEAITEAARWLDTEYSVHALRRRNLRAGRMERAIKALSAHGYSQEELSRHRRTLDRLHRPSQQSAFRVLLPDDQSDGMPLARLSAALVDTAADPTVLDHTSTHEVRPRQWAWRVLLLVCLATDGDSHEYLAGHTAFASIGWTEAADGGLGLCMADVYGIAECEEPWHGIIQRALAILDESREHPAIDDLLIHLEQFVEDEGGTSFATLPKHLLDARLLTVADADGLIEFGKRNHCRTGSGENATLHIESGWSFNSVTGRAMKPMAHFISEVLEYNGDPAIAVHVRLTPKGRIEAARAVRERTRPALSTDEQERLRRSLMQARQRIADIDYKAIGGTEAHRQLEIQQRAVMRIVQSTYPAAPLGGLAVLAGERDLLPAWESLSRRLEADHPDVMRVDDISDARLPLLGENRALHISPPDRIAVWIEHALSVVDVLLELLGCGTLSGSVNSAADRDSDSKSPHNNWYDATWYKAKAGIPPARLRQAAHDGRLQKRKRGRANLYPYGEVKALCLADWPDNLP